MAEVVDISRSDNVRDLILSGVESLVDSVKVTMGAGGRNVLIEKPFFTPILTKDGVTVAKSVTLENKFENMGAQLIKDVAQKTADEVGDGTTTATVLAGAIFKNSLPYVKSGYNPVKIKRYIDQYVKTILSSLQSLSVPVDNLESINNVAKISANGDIEIAQAITDAMDVVGTDGVITVENSNSFNTFVEYTEGVQFDCGYVSPYFINNPKKLETTFKSPMLLMINGVVNNFEDISNVLIQSINKNKPIVIFANDFSNDVINKTVQNRLQRNLQICLVRLPYYGEERKGFLEDLSILCDGSFIDLDMGDSLEEQSLNHLTYIDEITISKNNTTIIKKDINQDKISERIEYINAQLNDSKSPVEQNTLRDRISKLSGSVAIIRVGGSSEVEVQEKKDRIDDALHATKASIKEGVVPGGGCALLKCIANLKLENDTEKENLAAYQILTQSLNQPAKQIISNAGLPEKLIYNDKILKMDNMGFDVSKFCDFEDDYIKDLISVGIIDPLLVEKTALLNAVSVAGLLMTTECGIALKKKEDELM